MKPLSPDEYAAAVAKLDLKLADLQQRHEAWLEEQRGCLRAGGWTKQAAINGLELWAPPGWNGARTYTLTEAVRAVAA